MATATLSAPTASSEIAVTFEDQQKINRFARLNARLEEIRDELKSKKLDLQNMEDALNEISAAELTDDDNLGCRIVEGEVFVKFDYDKATSWIEDKKTGVGEEVENLNKTIDTIKDEMNQLKAALYAKFGKENINLESED
ncbi:Prefoldin subunit 4 [Halotydeus destructor]|nr:Prefoldin subunit 4 [Halotydeus destructor]